MNNTLKNLQIVDKNIVALDRVMRSNEHCAAGISLEMGVGATPDRHDKPDKTIRMSFGIYSDVQGLCEKLMACLEESRAEWAKQLQREADEATAYLSSVAIVTPTE